ncbi:YtxH domain-containing protein [Paenibacillus abyssi]|uniref:General stress protein n=1 Tax=Paenibacillus abyssi TaxID=1340531 RepID=A0A917LEP1_9BACL|nr:YtxH domain-containing protein [Paenibacillus abyssi]GGG15784.1 hypothetical protein GCM10010916_35900 [Paenibacillus abyssi]
MSDRPNQKARGFLLGALAGGVVAAVSALLLAPKSGRELRKDIAKGAGQISDTTVRYAGQAKDATVKVAQQVSSQTTQLADLTKQVTSRVVQDVKSWRGNRGSDFEQAPLVEEQAEEQTAEGQHKQAEQELEEASGYKA